LGISNAAMAIGKWDAAKHPRAAAGSAGGGRFAPLSYNSASNTGTGYGSAKGDGRVLAAQKALNRAKMTDADGKPLKLDGKLGPKTTAAIKRYQKAHGIKPADGKITPALLKQLKSGKGSPAPARTYKKAALKKPAAVKKTVPPARRLPMPANRGPLE
jgi:peptidoglycan hydrolase-like protein with peptidoglycan-binding domain